MKEYGRECLTLRADVGSEAEARRIVAQTLERYGEIHVLVNDAGEQHPQKRPEDITEEQLLPTFRTDVFAQFFIVKTALPHMKAGASIVNIASITAYEGKPDLVDYSSTTGAIVSFTRALSNAMESSGCPLEDATLEQPIPGDESAGPTLL